MTIEDFGKWMLLWHEEYVTAFYVGASEHQKKLDGDNRSRAEVWRDERQRKFEKRREKAAERRDRER